jgi:hypothetical protein
MSIMFPEAPTLTLLPQLLNMHALNITPLRPTRLKLMCPSGVTVARESTISLSRVTRILNRWLLTDEFVQVKSNASSGAFFPAPRARRISPSGVHGDARLNDVADFMSRDTND